MKTTTPKLRPCVLLFALVLFWLTLFTFSLYPLMPYNTLSERMRILPMITPFVPQGWGFFTRAAQEEDFYIYNRDKGVWKNAFLGPNGKAHFVFGWSRAARAQGVEYGKIFTQIPKARFERCQSNHLTCLEAYKKIEPLYEVENSSPSPTLCGTLGVILQKPVPWAWFKENQAIDMPSRVVRVNVKC